jgi:hypothetical protein
MKMKHVNGAMAVTIAIAFSMLVGCSNHADEPKGSGEAEFQITDAPSDDASVKGVFVTVTDLKVDGQSISGFSKQTIDLKAYQEGATKVLGSSTLAARSYSTITLVLDTDMDANGNAPGCYVLTDDNSRIKLRSGGKLDLVLKKVWAVESNGKSTVVMDFDLRKAIRKSDDSSVRYQFVNDVSLQSSVRVIARQNAGTITGTYVEQTSSASDKVIVYAYKKGTFNADTEVSSQNEEGVSFANAVNSAEVKGAGTAKSYTLAYLEPADYELHFASYKRNPSSNHFELQALLKAQLSVSGSINDKVAVQSGGSVTTAVLITGQM